MSDWSSIRWQIHLPDAFTEANIQRLIAHIRDWADNDDGYAEDIEYNPDARTIHCSTIGECGLNAETITCRYLEALSQQENADISLYLEVEGNESQNCHHFGPHADANTIQDALYELDNPIRAIEVSRAGITPQLRQAVTTKAQHLLDVIDAPVITVSRLRTLRQLIDRDFHASIVMIDKMISELEQAGQPHL